jgi:hypothetical protein
MRSMVSGFLAEISHAEFRCSMARWFTAAYTTEFSAAVVSESVFLVRILSSVDSAAATAQLGNIRPVQPRDLPPPTRVADRLLAARDAARQNNTEEPPQVDARS